MTIILDLDDVLANLRQSLYQSLVQASGIDVHWRHWRRYDLRDHYPTVLDRLEEILIDDRTVATTRALKDLGFEIAIVTARGWHPRAEAITRDWLGEHGIHHDHLRIVPLGANKLEVLTPFPRIALAVDDHPDHVRRYRQAGIPALLMDRPWNAGFRDEAGNGVTRITHCREIVRESHRRL